MMTVNSRHVSTTAQTSVPAASQSQQQRSTRVQASTTMRDVSSGETLFLKPFRDSYPREVFKWTQLLGEHVLQKFKFQRVENLKTGKYQARLMIDSNTKFVQVNGQKGVWVEHTTNAAKKVFVPVLWSQTDQIWYGHHMK